MQRDESHPAPPAFSLLYSTLDSNSPASIHLTYAALSSFGNQHLHSCHSACHVSWLHDKHLCETLQGHMSASATYMWTLDRAACSKRAVERGGQRHFAGTCIFILRYASERASGRRASEASTSKSRHLTLRLISSIPAHESGLTFTYSQ